MLKIVGAAYIILWEGRYFTYENVGYEIVACEGFR